MRIGGKCSASAGVSTDVTTSHTNGKISTRVAGTSTRCHGLNGSRNRRPGIAWTGAVTSGPVVGEPAADPELDRGDRDDDQEQEVGDRGGVAEVEVLEGLPVKVVDEHRGGVQRAARRTPPRCSSTTFTGRPSRTSTSATPPRSPTSC